ncbi:MULTISPECIES: hypothetical protein [unclassified Pseudomonas]|uniref:hypothetical protein n=1 Tax=unclassified Pseudomonas TaxID=196821 RepID=UPI00244D1745|nr:MULTISPECIES: hypothetical protein [unclassified Pseudomonas]MDG9922122.1 hypothetical protein [Pseudomonas sp. GD04045]MDH0033785.1 hypothetical protein [Pseudomonas sp. GD04019]
MQLNNLELFALDKLLHDHQPATEALRSAEARVLERVDTPAGFFAVIELQQRLRDVGEFAEREWKFKLKSPKSAGYFVCWPDGESTLCLEAVISKGSRPALLTAELFV